MNKHKFTELYNFLFPNGSAKKYCKAIFQTFDANDSGEIQFSDLMLSIALTVTGDAHKKLHIAFKLYDIDHNGLIDKQELHKIIRAIYDLSETNVSHELNSNDIKRIMDELDKDRDQFISREEFIGGCLTNPRIVEILFPLP